MSIIDDYVDAHPQYKDVPKDRIAGALYDKYYAGKVSREDFDKKVQDTESYGEKVKRTDENVLKVAGPGVKGVARMAGASAENVLSMGSRVAGDVAGAVTSVATQDASKGKKVQEAITYEPKTETGKAQKEYIGAVLAPVGKVFNWAPNKLEQAGHPVAAQVVQAVEDVLPVKIPKVIRGSADATKVAASTVKQFAQDVNAGKMLREAEEKAAAEKKGPLTEQEKMATHVNKIIEFASHSKLSGSAAVVGHVLGGPAVGAAAGGVVKGVQMGVKQTAKILADAKKGREARDAVNKAKTSGGPAPVQPSAQTSQGAEQLPLPLH